MACVLCSDAGLGEEDLALLTQHVWDRHASYTGLLPGPAASSSRAAATAQPGEGENADEGLEEAGAWVIEAKKKE